MLGLYILDGKTTVSCEDVNAWEEWMHKNKRHVADEMIGDVRISTVILILEDSKLLMQSRVLLQQDTH